MGTSINCMVTEGSWTFGGEHGIVYTTYVEL